MNCSRLIAFALLIFCAATAPGQNSLFSTATTAPATSKPAAGPRPIDVAASGGHTLTLTTNNQALVTYKKNVRVNDPEFFLHSQMLHLVLDLKGKRAAAPAVPNVPPAPHSTNTAQPLGHMGSFIELVRADGGVLLSNKLDGSFATAQRATYSSATDVFELEGDARVIKRFNAESAITNTAPRILFIRAERQFVLEGESATGGNVTPGSGTSSAAPKKP
jgi:hypothetical protein